MSGWTIRWVGVVGAGVGVVGVLGGASEMDKLTIFSLVAFSREVEFAYLMAESTIFF